jgi:ribosome-associated protein
MPRIVVTENISIDADELSESFVLSSGPGGQNVNKVSSAVQLRFDVAHSPSLTDEVRARVAALAGNRLTKDGIIIIAAQESRSQERNRVLARERLVELIQRAAKPAKPRRPTKPSKASKRRRLDEKSVRGKIKRNRGRVRED